jgi:hypothetical protein
MVVLICSVVHEYAFSFFNVFPIIYVFLFLSIYFLQMFDCTGLERKKETEIETPSVHFVKHLRGE